jgi:hypothetical protein
MRPIPKEKVPNRIVKTIEPNNKVSMTLVEIKNDGKTKKAQVGNIKRSGIS